MSRRDDRANAGSINATGVGAALIVDVLLALGVDDPFELSPEEQRGLIADAAIAGRIDEGRVAALRELGILESV